jgi:hypothetical protein
MKAVAEVIGVFRSNLAEHLRQHPQRRIGRPPLPDWGGFTDRLDQELAAQIKAEIAALPT